MQMSPKGLLQPDAGGMKHPCRMVRLQPAGVVSLHAFLLLMAVSEYVPYGFFKSKSGV